MTSELPDSTTDLDALLGEVETKAKIVRDLLNIGDQRLLASDGPCGGVPGDLSTKERLKVDRAAWLLVSELLPQLAAAVRALRARETALHGVTWLLIRNGHVLLERCEKKARVLGVGEWFVPGGKIESGETPIGTLRRELAEEWPWADLRTFTPLPIVEGSPVPPGPKGIFLMRPFVITVDGVPDEATPEGTPLRWVPIADALASPVPQVRMMMAAALPSPDSGAEDSVRLDWLEERISSSDYGLELDRVADDSQEDSPFFLIGLASHIAALGKGSDFRAAIDAARHAGGGQTDG